MQQHEESFKVEFGVSSRDSSYELFFDNIPDLLITAGSRCVYAPEINLQGFWWQTGIKSHCGPLFDHLGLYVVYSTWNEHNCVSSIVVQSDPSYGILKFPQRQFHPGEEASVLLCNIHSIPFCMRVSVHFEMKVEVCKSTRSITYPSNILQHELSTFLQTDLCFFDCQISVDGIKYKAHKCVLAARSEVFKALLLGNMTTLNSNEICINNVLPVVVHLMLHFMYHDNIDSTELQMYYSAVLDLAAQYEVKSLLSYLEKLFRKFVRDDNAMNIYLTSELYKLDGISELVVKYLQDNETVM